MDSVEYLQPGFDPASLTIPRLRSILVSHNVPYPSGAKKTALIEIFQENVLPQARKILAARDRARRTSKGITDVESSQESSTTGNDEDEAIPSLRTSRASTRRSGRARSDESESDVSITRSSTRRTPRGSRAAQLSEAELDEVETPRTVRKSRKSEAAPTPVSVATPRPSLKQRIKSEEVDDGLGVSRRQSNFSYDNPFQSGSSPPATDVSGGERSRKSLGEAKESLRRKSTTASTKRRSSGPGAARADRSSTSETYEIPVSELKWTGSTEPFESIEPSEEFTPEEQLELVRERSANGMALMPPRRVPRTQAGGDWKGPIWMVVLTLLGGYATWYRQEKVAVGYCGVGREAHSVVPVNVEIPDWLRIVAEPQCEPCPQHAYCSGNMVTQCEANFVLKPHPLSVGGLVPIPPTCEPDGEKARRVKAVADRAVEELRERRAKWECGDLVDEQGAPAVTVELDAQKLKGEVSMKRRKGMSQAEFEELWDSAIGEINGRDEVESRADGPRILLTSTSLARLPLSCAIRRSFRQSLERHRRQIASLIIILGLVAYLRHLIKSRGAAKARIPQLVSLTLDRLSTQVSLHAQDPETFPESWIPIGQLRDDVLRDEHSIKKREALWSRVRNVVEMNANIRSSQRESRNGEISRVWEWIGAVGNLEEGDGKRRRKSGRVSWGTYDENSSPVSGMDDGPKKWEEGRPIY